MKTPSVTPHLLITSLFGLMLAPGCDTFETKESEEVEALAAALELSPNQDLVEFEKFDAVMFESVELNFTEDTAEEDPELYGSGCTLLRPAGWSGAGVTCVEYFKAPGGPPDTLPMSNGQSFITFANYSFPSGGSGHAQISCNNGNISIQALSCKLGVHPF